MYKFSNGVVVFDEKTKEEYIKLGLKLVEEKIETPIEEQVTIDEAIEREINEDSNNGKPIKRKPTESRKTSK